MGPICNWSICNIKFYRLGKWVFIFKQFKRKKKKIFFDIGCHSGYFLISFKDLFERSIGFEPSLKCCKILQENKLEFRNCFVGKKSGFEFEQENSDGYSFYQQSKIENPHAKKLPLITLDDFYKQNNLSNVTAIKIDIDGRDLDVLIGAKKLIVRDRPSILIENYSDSLFDFFKDLDYTLVSLVSTKNKPYNLSLKYFDKYEPGVWTKMMCCIPTEYIDNNKNEQFSGNIFFGINKKKILKTFKF